MRRPLLPNALLKRLQRGLALGADRHVGFADTWSWIVDYLHRAKEFFATTVNGDVGDISIIAGEGIDVSTNDGVITISIGHGETSDSGGGGGDSGGGGSNGGGSSPSPSTDDSDASGQNGDSDPIVGAGSFTVGSFDEFTATIPADLEAQEGGCNTATGEMPDNGNSDIPANLGDDCTELNGGK